MLLGLGSGGARYALRKILKPEGARPVARSWLDVVIFKKRSEVCR
jgi:hypothetical protein